MFLSIVFVLNWESADVKFDAALSMVYGYNCFAELLPLALLSSVLAPWSLRCCSLVPVLRCISFLLMLETAIILICVASQLPMMIEGLICTFMLARTRSMAIIE